MITEFYQQWKHRRWENHLSRKETSMGERVRESFKLLFSTRSLTIDFWTMDRSLGTQQSALKMWQLCRCISEQKIVNVSYKVLAKHLLLFLLNYSKQKSIELSLLIDEELSLLMNSDEIVSKCHSPLAIPYPRNRDVVKYQWFFIKRYGREWVPGMVLAFSGSNKNSFCWGRIRFLKTMTTKIQSSTSNLNLSHTSL